MNTKKKIIIVDPGERQSENVINWLIANNQKPDYCLITHEHFDHNIGYQKIVKKFNVKTLCSNEKKEALKKSNKNLKLNHDQRFTFAMLRRFLIACGFPNESFVTRERNSWQESKYISF